MFDEPMWGAMSSWFTPTTLFVLLNFMIATIYFTSGFSSNKPHPLTKSDSHQQDTQSEHTSPVLLQRSPSVLQRLKSINFYQYAHYNKSEPSQATSFQTDQYRNDGGRESVLNNTTSFDSDEHENDYGSEEEDGFDFDHEGEDEVDRERSIEEVFSEMQVEKRPNVVRTKSDTEPASGFVPVKLVKKMKKSASSKSAFRHFSEAEVLEARRPATAREVKTVVEADDEEVDTKADDFINKFKQQLKLQRMDSILRYKEMLGRGAGK